METTQSEGIDTKTRANLAYMLVLAAVLMLGYILYRWGDKTEILTLVIGLIGGSMLGAVTAIYFGGVMSQKKPDTGTTTAITDADKVNITNNPPVQ